VQLQAEERARIKSACCGSLVQMATSACPHGDGDLLVAQHQLHTDLG